MCWRKKAIQCLFQQVLAEENFFTYYFLLLLSSHKLTITSMENELDDFAGESIKLTNMSLVNLGSIAKWAKFFGILGFVMIGLMLIFGVFFGTILAQSFSNMPSRVGGPSPILFSVIYIVLALIYFFPVRFMYQFATKMTRGIKNNDQMDFDASLAALKSHFTFVGIVTIIVLSIYALVFILGMISFLAVRSV